MSGAKVRLRWFLILTVLMGVALLRAERGVAELQGRVGHPSRMLRLAPQPNGDWTMTVMGLDQRIPVQRLMSAVREQAVRIGEALP